ncbi:DUF257 family protein [Thermococcus camini]|uniref:KaiC-like domain-containing protein n=1 Tax=Thermococcus camini TaxID=2016373 RepID=A0A7G2D547_9EURY|nr:DUF257 family protein [Thermococcus camini]CAD5243558.1 conserved protein of unknown function [Thermococcus camini]
MLSTERVYEYLDSVFFGDVILVENESPYGTALMTHLIAEYGRKKGVPVYVDDILDSLHVVREHLRFLGIDEDFSDVSVIKTGGVKSIGNVVARIGIESDAARYLNRHREALREAAPGKRYIHITLGIERLFAFFESKREFYMTTGAIKERLGDESHVSFYILNRSVVSALRTNPIPELEEIATTVVRIQLRNKRHALVFAKGPTLRIVDGDMIAYLDGSAR